MKILVKASLFFALLLNLVAQEKVAPTLADVKYGPHKRDLMNLWLVETDKPLGVLVHIHGAAG